MPHPEVRPDVLDSTLRNVTAVAKRGNNPAFRSVTELLGELVLAFDAFKIDVLNNRDDAVLVRDLLCITEVCIGGMATIEQRHVPAEAPPAPKDPE